MNTQAQSTDTVDPSVNANVNAQQVDKVDDSGGQSTSTLLTSTDGGNGSVASKDGSEGDASTTTKDGGDSTVALPENWKEALPQELRDDPAMGIITDVKSLAKSYLHAQKSIGADKVVVPSKHATDEEKFDFAVRLGLPQSLDAYEIKVPDNDFLDQGVIDSMKEISWKSGIMPEQFNKLIEAYAGSFAEQQAAFQKEQEASAEKGREELKKEWGQAYENEMTKAKQGVKEVADEAFSKWLDESRMGDNPMFIRIFNRVGKLLSEDKLQDGGGEGGPVTPNTAQQELAKIRADKDHPYNLREHANHQQAVAEVNRLAEMAWPNDRK